MGFFIFLCYFLFACFCVIVVSHCFCFASFDFCFCEVFLGFLFLADFFFKERENLKLSGEGGGEELGGIGGGKHDQNCTKNVFVF